MNRRLTRRRLVTGGMGAALAQTLPFAGLLAPRRASAQDRRFEPQPGAWRSFELTTTVNVAEVKGATQLWLPLPDIDGPYQRSVDNSWSGNASSVRIASDSQRGARMLYASFDAGVAAPTLSLTSRVQTRNRAVDWSKPQPVAEDPAVLKAHLAPSELMPTDGIVRETANQALQAAGFKTNGAATDVDKVRVLYDWVIANAYREPKTRGCGAGDVKTMLETGNLGGKCADLNAIFVSLCRSVGVPARDVYGLRVVPSAFGYKELGGNPANLKGAQHCRAEVYLRRYGWVAMDPADVLKVMRQETGDWIKDPRNPVAAPVNRALFGGWEGNWVGFNTAHDLRLPGSSAKGTLPFLMYPQGENASGRFDELAPDSFRYAITARELSA